MDVIFKSIIYNYYIENFEKMQKQNVWKNEPIQSRYIMGDFIGGGASGMVYSAFRKQDNLPVAIKIYNKYCMTAKQQLSIQNQCLILFFIDHPNIVKLYQVFQNKEELLLVMQVMRGGELIQHIIEKQHYSQLQAKNVFSAIVDALRYLHSNNIIHRDLKPQNILYQSNQVDAIIKIADFGLSKNLINKQVMTTHVGTPGYWAPQVINNTFDQVGYDFKADYWSLGVLLYILLSGQHPFDQQLEISQQQVLIRDGKYSFEQNDQWKNISDEAKDLISHLLEVNPQKRYGAQQILKHPWIRNDNSRVNLMGTTKKLQKYNKLRKWKRAKLALDFITRLQMILKNKGIDSKISQRMSQSMSRASKNLDQIKKMMDNKSNNENIKKIIKRTDSKEMV